MARRQIAPADAPENDKNLLIALFLSAALSRSRLRRATLLPAGVFEKQGG